MSTINYQYIADRIPEETLKPLMTTADSSEIDINLIDEYILDAESEVDNAISSRYVYPYVKIDDELGNKSLNLIRRWKFLIVRQLIYARKYDDEDMKEVNAHHNAVMNILGQIRRGEYHLQGLTPKYNEPSKYIKSNCNPKIFKSQRLKL